MESLCYGLNERGLLFADEMELQLDALARNQDLAKGHDFDPPSEFDKRMLIPGRETDKTPEHREFSFHLKVGTLPFCNRRLGFSDAEATENSEKTDGTTSMITMDPFVGEMEFGSGVSVSEIRAGNRKGIFNCPQLEKSTSTTEIKSNESVKGNAILCVDSSSPVKKAKTMNIQLQTPLCQVFGCNKDLSSSKDYHKRHKVCEVHSKTPIVIVNGIEQRFCQQCSRFHLLAEFDDVKRSCRKRLAGHNERRRKPQMDTHLSSRFFEATLQKGTSFLRPEVLCGGFFCQERNEQHIYGRHVKLEDEPFHISQLELPIKWPADQNPLPFPKESEKPTPFKDHHSSTFTIQDLSSGPRSSCALSLLSAQSMFSSNSAGISMALPLITKEKHNACIAIDQASEPLRSCASEASMPKGNYPSSRVGPGEIILSDHNTVFFNSQVDKHMQISNMPNDKNSLSPEVGVTVDLVQLSSHLQRVEQQRNSVQLKQENDMFSEVPFALF